MHRYIDADALRKQISETYEYEFPTASGGFDEFATKIIPNIINNAITADVVPVVRCRECANAKRIDKNESVYTCTHPQWTRRPHKDTFEESQLFHGLDGNDFCSYGERKEDRK